MSLLFDAKTVVDLKGAGVNDMLGEKRHAAAGGR